jgi:hypothetical protein
MDIHPHTPSASTANLESPTNPVVDTSDEQSRGVVLDGFALLKHCHVQHPNEAEICIANGKNIESVVAEDASYFKNLK